jgi:hypothetical protein
MRRKAALLIRLAVTVPFACARIFCRFCRSSPPFSDESTTAIRLSGMSNTPARHRISAKTAASPRASSPPPTCRSASCRDSELCHRPNPRTKRNEKKTHKHARSGWPSSVFRRSLNHAERVCFARARGAVRSSLHAFFPIFPERRGTPRSEHYRPKGQRSRWAPIRERT